MTSRRRLGPLIALAVIALLMLLVRAQRASLDPPLAAEDGGAPVDDAADGARGRAASGVAAGPSPTVRRVPDAREALGAPDPALVWREQVAGALRTIARDRLGHPLTPADEAQVLDALKSVGPAARGLDREELDPDDPASIARVREQTATLVDADRVCRDALGIGVAELIRMLDPSGVDDQGAAPE